MKRDLLIALSGGIDSTTLAYHAIAQGKHPRSLYCDYGKRVSARELEATKLTSLILDMPLEIVGCEGITRLQYGYLPWSRAILADADWKDDFRVSELKDSKVDELSKAPAGTPHWFRITGFHHLIGIATYLAQITNIQEIALGLTKEQATVIPELRKTLDKWCEFIELLNPEAGPFSIYTPLIDKTKPEIIDIGAKLGVPFNATWGCVGSVDMHCGRCSRCYDRKEAFANSGVQDPTEYE